MDHSPDFPDPKHRIFTDADAADAILSEMIEIFFDHGEVTLADFYLLTKCKTVPNDSYKYGWRSLRNTSVRKTDKGYILDLPPFVDLRMSRKESLHNDN